MSAVAPRDVTPPGRDHPLESLEPQRVLVQAGNQRQRLAARLQKGLTPPQSDFLERLEAIGDECRTKDYQPLDAGWGEPDQFLIGIGLQPRLRAKARLEGDGVLAGRDA